MKHVTLKQLEIFLSIAKTGNVSHAAKEIFLTQAACSMALNNLEEQLEGDLFDRHGKKLTLNDRGRLLYSKAQKIISQCADLQDNLLNKDISKLSGKLIIGASSTIGNYILPEWIGKFLATYSSATIQLKIDNTSHILQKLLDFSIDFALVEGHCHFLELETNFWKKDELVIIASKKQALDKKNKLNPELFLKEKWIFREEGSGTREIFGAAVDNKITPFLELGHTEAIKSAVQADLGISCVSKAAVLRELKHGDLATLSAPFLKLSRNLYLVIHKEKYKTKLLTAFLNFINEKTMHK